MKAQLERHLKGQTPYGVFHNLNVPGDCGGVKYVSIHFRTLRLWFTWLEKTK